MGDNPVDDDTLMDLDLNQEPPEPPVGSVLGLGSLLTELETAHGRIEERIRQLEAVTLRARMRQSWRQVRNSESNTLPVGTMLNVDDAVAESRVVAADRNNGGTSCQKDSSCLVAKALEMDSDIKKNVHDDGGNFFDCNICLYMAREPIITCCGHLFCWACFLKLPYVDSTAKECPVCKGEVTDSTIIPIYGTGDCNRDSKVESSMTVPPRPKAQRVESIRQRRLTRGISHIPVVEALRRIRTSIGELGNQPQEDPANVSLIFGTTSRELQLPNEEVIRFRRLPSRQFSRVLSESAASLSSISSELNSAERNAAISQLEHQTSTEEISSVVPVPLSSSTNDGSHAVQQTRNLPTSPAGGLHLPLPPASSSSRRRSGSSRVLDMENVVSQESRRRRLN